MSGDKRPVVAELGRPETPGETADRKAEASRRYRASKTTKNLLWALAATVGVAAVLVLLVNRPDAPIEGSPQLATIDVAATAAQAESSLGATPAVPELDGWAANAARLEPSTDDVTSWYVGYLTPDGDYAGMRQGVNANQTWVSQQVGAARATGDRTIAGVTRVEYDRRAADPTGINAYSLAAMIEESTIVLFGTASDDDFDLLATAVVQSLRQSN
ncbi:MAG TPA: DUF4245 domain-containing protein [Terrimesophilobacter sp.]|nr:DUF4245 domain-containing protein [Terrimesophilobacter sp.]